MPQPPLRGVTLSLVLATIAVGSCAPRSGPSSLAPEGAAPRLYVANQDAAAISVIDPSAGTVVDVIDLEAMGFGAQARPHHVAVDPDGSHWYASLIGANRVLKFDSDNELVGSAEMEVPGLMALDPDSDWLFVGRSMAAVNPPQRIARIDRTTMTVEEFDVFIPRPHGLTLGPAGTLYVGSVAENTLAVMGRETGHVDLVRFEGGMPGMPHMVVQVAVSPDGRTLVATGEMSGVLAVFSLDDAGVPTYERDVAVGAAPWHPVFSPDGAEVWVGAQRDDRVVVVDAETWTVAGAIDDPAISEPHGSAISGDGQLVFIANRNTDGAFRGSSDFGYARPPGTVVIIDRATRDVVRIVETPPHAAGIALGTSAIGLGGGTTDASGGARSWTRRVAPFPVTDQSGDPMDHPFLGGFNAPRPQLADLNGNGIVDLVVQESNDRLLFFEGTEPRTGSVGNGTLPEDVGPTYVFRPEVFSDLRVGEWYRFVDVDGDGRMDLLSEQPFSYIQLHRNIADAGSLPRFELIADTIRDTRGEPIFSDRQNIPNAADLDCDGSLDLLLGRMQGTISHYEATGVLRSGAAPFRHVTDRFQGIEIVGDPLGTPGTPTQPVSPLGALFRPSTDSGWGWLPTARHGANTMALVDIDGDGDIDLFWGDFFEPGLLFIENRGTCQSPNLRTAPVPFPESDPIATSGYNAPTFGDTNGNGNLDLVMGVLGGAYNPNTTTADNLYHLTQDDDGTFHLQTRRFLSQIDVGTESAPVLVDLDGDGDLDLLVSNRIDPENLNRSRIHVFRNVGTAARPAFRADGTLDLDGDEYHRVPAFGDLDGDGDLDLVLGTWRAEIHYFENMGSPEDPVFERAASPLATLPRGSNAVPALGDLDGDGDLDLVVGTASGTLAYFENVGTATSPQFELATDRLLDTDLGRRAYPVLLDWDGDGDLDLVVGTESAGLVYYENRGTPDAPDFERVDEMLPDTNELPALAAPSFGDLTGDGRLELVVGGAGGGVYYFEAESGG